MSREIGHGIEWPAASCCWPGYPGGCACTPMERALRGWHRGEITAPMTHEQREVCLDEIGGIEGYRRCDYENCSDAEIAGGVISAWLDYCRDKGLTP